MRQNVEFAFKNVSFWWTKCRGQTPVAWFLEYVRTCAVHFFAPRLIICRRSCCWKFVLECQYTWVLWKQNNVFGKSLCCGLEGISTWLCCLESEICTKNLENEPGKVEVNKTHPKQDPHMPDIFLASLKTYSHGKKDAFDKSQPWHFSHRFSHVDHDV